MTAIYGMLSFADWVKMKESSPFTRTRREVALGLKPPAALGGNPNSRSTAQPWELAAIQMQINKDKKKKKEGEPLEEGKFGATLNKKKVAVTNKNTQVDKWLQEVEALKKDISDLKDALDKKKKEKPQPEEKPKKTVGPKPEDEKPEEKDEKPEKPEGNEEEETEKVEKKPQPKPDQQSEKKPQQPPKPFQKKVVPKPMDKKKIKEEMAVLSGMSLN